MVRVVSTASRRQAGRLFGASLAALAFSSAAKAQCAPDPTVAGGTTVCAGLDSNGLVVNTAPTTVQVNAGAELRAGAQGSSILFTPPAGSSATQTLRVDGALTDGFRLVTPTGTNQQFTSANLVATVAAGASVTGATAIRLDGTATNTFQNSSSLTLTNSGTIRSTTGPAILASGNRTGIGSLTNTATGAIGGIYATVQNLTNAGLIDGGTGSAYRPIDPNTVASSTPFTLANTGIIRSNGTVATIAPGVFSITNSGQIANAGSGRAIEGTALSVNNAQGGSISSSGSTALASNDYISLVNRGAITSSVLVSTAASSFLRQSLIDTSRGGTIAGGITLGGADDVVVADYDGTRILGISGTVDAGGGTNTFRGVVSGMRTLTSLILPTSFQRLELTAADRAIVTLAPGTVLPVPLAISGSGTIINNADVTATGPVITAPFSSEGRVTFVNNARIVSTLTNAISLNFSGAGVVTNAGTVSTTGSGIAVAGSSLTRFTNSGTIEADQTALSLFASPLVNSGRITSRQGIGLSLSGNGTEPSVNSGIIEGATIGATVFGALQNSGTIRSAGTAVRLDSSSGISNRQGGTITGGTAAITSFTFGNLSIANAGTINGDVRLNNSGFQSFGTGNVYASLGGVLNGNLVLGNGSDLFITDLVNTGPGAFAGVTGTVTGGGNSSIRYRVASDAATTAVLPPAFFTSVGYELANNATLRLTVPQGYGRPLLLNGIGSVDITGDLSGTSGPLIRTAPGYQAPDTVSSTAATPPSQIAITSRGTITFQPQGGTLAAVAIGNGDTFTNAGTMELRRGGAETGVPRYSLIAGSNDFLTSYGGAVVNPGTIRLDGGIAVRDTTSLTNSGTITQIAGGTAGTAALNVRRIVNTGTITAGATAVDATGSTSGTSNVFGSGPDAYLVTNSGSIVSSGGTAVRSVNSMIVTNRAGATITGAGTAIQLGTDGRVINQGTINGNVLLSTLGGLGSVYVADGGRLNGDLRFGNGNDILVIGPGGAGVTGAIDGGGGLDAIVQRFTASGTVRLGEIALPTNFEGEGVEALGAGTIVTVTGPAAGSVTRSVRFLGDGTVVNTADLPTVVQLGARADGADTAGVAFTNSGRIASSVFGVSRAFANSGTIGRPDLSGNAVSLSLDGTAPFTFTNSGTIAASGLDRFSGTIRIGQPAVVLSRVLGVATPLPATMAVTNGGTIAGGLSASLRTAALAFTNSGTITRNAANTVAVVVTNEVGIDDNVASQLTFANSGTLSADAVASAALILSSSTLPSSGSPTTVDLSVRAPTLTLTNSGTIRSEQGGQLTPNVQFVGNRVDLAVAAALTGSVGTRVSLTNAAGGTISATGADSIALVLSAPRGTIALTNAGTIGGAPGTTETAANQRFITGAFFVGTNPVTGAITVLSGTTTLRNTGTITGAIRFYRGSTTAANGDTVSGVGNDRVENAGLIDGNVFMDEGDDTFVDLNGSRITGVVDGGTGSNGLVIDTSGRTGGTFDFNRFTRFQSVSLTGTGSVGLAGALPFPTVQLNGGGLTVAAGTMLSTTGPTTITGSDQAETIVNRGRIAGNVALGGGNDTFAVYAGSSFGGTVDGGAGTDTVALYSAGSDTAPTPFSTAGFSNFERLAQIEGVTGLSGTAAFGQIAVTGGRLIGLAGSTISASEGITVATGATFGSAGTVIGNVAVAGTLSPGASPGTMTVIGNVALAGGSTTLFELTPTVSDQLLVSGNISIASGATLTLTGTRAPGATPLDLIVANGGINGSFTTVNQAATVLGFLRQAGDRIQLIGRFSTAGLTPQATSAANYLSDGLAAGPASAASRAVLPSLLTANGASDGRALARITPEAYASATQITIENGLTLAKAARSSVAAAPREEPGAFTFAQGLGGWRSFNGNDAYGTSRFEQDSYGMLGGIGYGTGAFSVAGFAGYLKTFQKSPALSARTDADGLVAGAIGHAALGGFTLSTMLAYDGSKADTRRTLPGNTRANSRYDLHGWTADAAVGYALPLNANWAVKPEAGLTFVSSRRQGASETGSPFALNVARRKAHATFADAAITLTGGVADGARVHPWASLGLRHQLNGRGTFALAAFPGRAGTFGAIGVRRQATLATLGAGFSAELTRTIGLFAAYRGDLGSQGQGAAFNTGVRLRF